MNNLDTTYHKLHQHYRAQLYAGQYDAQLLLMLRMLEHLRRCRGAAPDPDTVPPPPQSKVARVRQGIALSARQARAIRQRYADGATQSAIAHEFGVSRQAINKIVNNHVWKEG